MVAEVEEKTDWKMEWIPDLEWVESESSEGKEPEQSSPERQPKSPSYAQPIAAQMNRKKAKQDEASSGKH